MNDAPADATVTCKSCNHVNPARARFCGDCGFALRASAVPPPGPDFDEPVADPLIGRVVADRYRIQSVLGRGGMGVVYRVEHIHIGKPMAMKLLHGELSRDKASVRRFQREAEAASRLSHPNTVQVFDFGRVEGLTYLIMELVDGDDYAALIKQRGRLPFAEVARLCAQVCASLAEAHAAGIVHRDLKPENVMIQQGESGDIAKVCDFGLAKLRETENAHTVTRAGAIVGTPYYMAPEQIRGEDVDARCDIYAIGAMMYRALTGTPPFSANTPMGVLTRHLTDMPDAPSTRALGVPPEVDAIILRALEKDPENRQQSARELQGQLIEWLRAAGEDPGPAAISSESWASTATGAVRVPREAASTREEIDAYERRLRRKGMLSAAGIVLLLIGAVATSIFGYYRYQQADRFENMETEPNNESATAHALPPGRPVRGHLGQRQSVREGDVDIYRLEREGGQPSHATITVSGLPNLDIMFELFREGESVLRVNNGGVGEPESVPAFPLGPSRYYLQVRERWIVGQYPVENVSDTYEVTWNEVTPPSDDEGEVNDRPEVATQVRVGEHRVGHIGWMGDEDYYCFEGDAESASVRLEGAEGMDLALRIEDGALGTEHIVDATGIGEEELSGPIAPVRARTSCVVVLARKAAREGAEEPIAASAEATYTIHFVATDSDG